MTPRSVHVLRRSGWRRTVYTYLEILRDTQPRRVGDDGDLAEALKREVPGGRSSKAVSRRPDPGYALSLQRSDCVFNCRNPAVGAVTGNPSCAIEVGATYRVRGARVPLEEIWNYRTVAVAREVVGKQLSQRSVVNLDCVQPEGNRRKADLVVDQRDTENISEEEDHLVLGVFAGGRSYIALYASDLLDLAWTPSG